MFAPLYLAGVQAAQFHSIPQVELLGFVQIQVHIHCMRPCCDPCTQLPVPLSPTTMSLAGYSLGLCPEDCQEPTWHGLTSGIGQGRTY